MNGIKRWRLGKTLRRKIDVRPIEQADVKYAWAAYKFRRLEALGSPFDKDGLSADDFKQAFEQYIFANTHGAWTVIALTKNGFIPVAIALGAWAPMQAYMVITGISWFPWCTKRNIVEGTVKFFNQIRRELRWMGFASAEHKQLYEVCCMHGIMRRIGTSNMTDKPIAVYEGRG